MSSRRHLCDFISITFDWDNSNTFDTSHISDAHLPTWTTSRLVPCISIVMLQEVSRYKGSNELFQLTTVSYCQISYCRMLDNTIFHLISWSECSQLLVLWYFCGKNITIANTAIFLHQKCWQNFRLSAKTCHGIVCRFKTAPRSNKAPTQSKTAQSIFKILLHIWEQNNNFLTVSNIQFLTDCTKI